MRTGQETCRRDRLGLVLFFFPRAERSADSICLCACWFLVCEALQAKPTCRRKSRRVLTPAGNFFCWNALLALLSAEGVRDGSPFSQRPHYGLPLPSLHVHQADLFGLFSCSNKIVNPYRKAEKPNMRSKDTIKRLAMYKAKPVRDFRGKIVSGPFMNPTADEPVKRIQPDRRWFGS